MNEFIIKQAELYYRSGNSDKMYIITLSKPRTSGGYHVTARWGWRESITPLGGGMSQVYSQGTNFDYARAYAQNLLEKKLRNGYTLRSNGITPTPYAETLIFVGISEPDRIGYQIDRVLETEKVIDNQEDLPNNSPQGRRRKLVIARA